MSDEYAEIIDTIRDALWSEAAHEHRAVDYSMLYEFARRHGVAATIADEICARAEVSDDIRGKFTKQKLITIAQQVSREQALQDLVPRLDKANVPCIFLKGTFLCELYPSKHMRSMSDVDVYTEQETIDTIHSVMLSLGYKTGVMGYGNHYEYSLGGYLKVEYHPELVALNSVYGSGVYSNLHPDGPLIATRLGVWEHSEPIGEGGYARRLLPEHHYAYVIMHAMGHFLGAGTGIRSIMDVWVMNRRYANSWDCGVVDALLEDFGLVAFESFALALARRWFGDPGLDGKSDSVDVELLNDFEGYILESGTYGTFEHSVARDVKDATGVRGRLRYLLGRYFLPYGTMSELYPIVEKLPVLLPLAWPYRLVEMVVKRCHGTWHKLKTVGTVGSDQIATQRQLFDALTEVDAYGLG